MAALSDGGMIIMENGKKTFADQVSVAVLPTAWLEAS